MDKFVELFTVSKIPEEIKEESGEMELFKKQMDEDVNIHKMDKFIEIFTMNKSEVNITLMIGDYLDIGMQDCPDCKLHFHAPKEDRNCIHCSYKVVFCPECDIGVGCFCYICDRDLYRCNTEKCMMVDKKKNICEMCLFIISQ